MPLRLGSIAGDLHILRGIDLHIEQAETVSVVGPSGSGKSSMLMVIAGLERASSGDVMVTWGGRLYLFAYRPLVYGGRSYAGILAAGFQVTHTATFRMTDTRVIRDTSPAAVAQLVRGESGQAGRFDAVFISCTQLHSMACLAELERVLGVPVISSNSATLWAGLGAVGVSGAPVEAGALFQP